MATVKDILKKAASMKTTQFPGMDKLGTESKPVADAVAFALRTIDWAGCKEAMVAIGTYENTESFGRLAAMVEYGVVDAAEVIAAIDFWSAQA